MGKKGESEILPILRQYFNRDIQEYPQQYSKYDFYDDIYEYECKTRRNTLNAYETTMITSNKLRDDKPLILLFNYTDCLGFIEYNKDKFNKYQKEMFSRARISEDEKEHIYIPISDLTIIHRKPVQQFPSYNNIHYLFSDA